MKKYSKFSDYSTYNILHYNCRILVGEERLYEFEKALEDIKWHVIELAEVKRVKI